MMFRFLEGMCFMGRDFGLLEGQRRARRALASVHLYTHGIRWWACDLLGGRRRMGG